VCKKENVAVTGVIEVMDYTITVKNDDNVSVNPVYKLRFDLHDGKCVIDFGLVLAEFLGKNRNVLGKNGNVLG
jgi:hypothetical protein